MIRNGGGATTEDGLRSLVVSTRVIGTQEILIVTHTECGFNNLREDEFAAKLENETGQAHGLADGFYSFTDAEENTRRQVQRVRSHPWIPRTAPVRGVIYDVRTGELREVQQRLIVESETAGL